MFAKIWVLIFPLVLFLASGAAAQGTYETTMGEILSESLDSGSKRSILSLIWALSVLVGIILVFKGLVQLIKDTETGSKAGMGNGLLKIFSGALLFSLTTLVGTLAVSWMPGAGGVDLTEYATSASSLRNPETEFEVSGCTYSQRINLANPNCYPAAFANFARDLAGPLIQALIFISVVWGLFLVGTGVSRLANVQNPSSTYFDRTGAVILRIIFGSLAISLPVFLNAASNSLFGGQADAFEVSILAQSPKDFVDEKFVQVSGTVGYYSEMMGYIFYGLIPFGLFAFASGLNSFVKASDGQQSGGGGLGAGAVKMVAGILLVNGKIFTCSMASTFGAKVDLIGFCATKIP